MTQRERIVACAMFVISAIAFFDFQLVTALLHHVDSAFLMEALDSIRNFGVPINHLTVATTDALPTFRQTAELICKSDLIPSGAGESVLAVHAYFILYPLALLTWIAPSYVVLALVNTVAFTSFILIAYFILRRAAVPIVAAIAFCVLVAAHPAWSHAFLGDFYVDRFFMPLGLLYAFLLHSALAPPGQVGKTNLAMILATGTLAAATTERAAIMIGVFTLAILVLFPASSLSRTAKVALALFGVALLAYVALYLNWQFGQHPGQSGLRRNSIGLGEFFGQLADPVYGRNIREFAATNVLFFGLFAFFDWRLALIAFGTLLPNLFISVGGAELTGWATHYHSMYFPFLVFASATGFARLWHSLSAARYQLVLIGVVAVLVPVLSKYSTGYGDVAGAPRRLYAYYASGSQAWERQLFANVQRIAAAIPTGARVTIPEGFAPSLYRGRTVYFYPMGIDTADFTVLSKVSRPDGTHYFAGAASHIGEAQKADMCLTERLRKAGYDVDNPRLLIDGSYAVLERKK